MKLDATLYERPWGRTQLPPPFDTMPSIPGPAGEIWFEPPGGVFLPVLVKYIFTAAKLSVQVHPDDGYAQRAGLRAGKNECWYILDAEPGAALGLGTIEPLDAEQLRAAALDGSIERLMEWKPVRPGEFYTIPAGTIHAIGAGISLVEVQQNSDVTYRLYDYGRPRELHLDDGVAVAQAAPYPEDLIQRVDPDGAVEQPLAHFPQFDVVYSRDVWSSRANRMERPMWIVPLVGEVVAQGDTARPGELLYLSPNEGLEPPQGKTAALMAIGVGDEIAS